MKLFFIISTLFLTTQSFGVENKLTQKCNEAIIKELLNDGLNVCGAVSPSNEEENVFFVTFMPAEGKSPKPLSNGDCKIIKTEDQGV